MGRRHQPGAERPVRTMRIHTNKSRTGSKQEGSRATVRGGVVRRESGGTGEGKSIQRRTKIRFAACLARLPVREKSDEDAHG